jgi:glycerol-3-phosphate dehydrogenase
VALGFNLVLRGRACEDALGVRLAAADDDPAGSGERYFFITPWRESTLVGTAYRRHVGDLDQLPQVDWRRLLTAVDAALPDLRLEEREVVRLHRGFVPLASTDDALESRDRVHDYAGEGLPGALSIASAKLTTARACAARAVARIAQYLGREKEGAETLRLPLHGGEEGWDALLEERSAGADPIGRRLAPKHGARVPALLRLFDDHPRWSEPVVAGRPLLRGELLHAIVEEAACHLDDLLLRRTDAGAEGCPPADELTAAAAVAGEALGWSDHRQLDEIDRVRRACAVPEI